MKYRIGRLGGAGIVPVCLAVGVMRVYRRTCRPASLLCVVLFIVTSHGMLQAQVVAGPDRPAEVPEGYVITPFGYFDPSCVLRLAEGETLLTGGRVQHADGTTELNPAVCNYPHYTPTGLLVAKGATKVSGPNTPNVNGWLEAVSVATGESYGEIIATWGVPPTPATDDGQTLFLFPGLEDINDVQSILQPVLQWYTPGPWAIASWNCCLNGIAVESTPLDVSPGDTILGTITSSCAAGSLTCAIWNVKSEDVSTGKSTTLSKTPSDGQEWNWAFAAVLEVYGVVNCNDYPAGKSIAFSTTVYDQNLKTISYPGWSGSLPTVTPPCNYGVSMTAKNMTLSY